MKERARLQSCRHSHHLPSVISLFAQCDAVSSHLRKAVVEQPKPPVEPSKPADEPVKPPPTLQTTPAAAEGEVERAIRATLARATSNLNRINVRGLNADAQTQYNTAKRFVTQAEEAIRAKNLVFARSVADKAAALAAQLAVK